MHMFIYVVDYAIKSQLEAPSPGKASMTLSTGWPWRHTDKWISIEEAESAWFQMFGGRNLPEDAHPQSKSKV